MILYLHKVYGTALALGLALACCLAPRQVVAQSTACANDVVVQSGDSLASIAGRAFGDASAYTRIIDATNAQVARDPSYARITDAGLIQVGWKLCIPGTTPAAVQPARLNSLIRTEDASALMAAIAEAFDPVQIRALAIPTMRARTYPGSALVVEQTLAPGINYTQSIVSYRSDGLKLFALMTVPTGTRPATGWPVIVFNHGYVPPERYRATERYEAHVDALARNGYIVLRPDYRGHGASEGVAAGGYAGPAYTVDVLNAVASIRRYAAADPARIGMWGHSLGGMITLRSMVIDDSIKAGVVWSGVVVAVPDLLALLDFSPVPLPNEVFRFRDQLFGEFGTPQTNPDFWKSISPNNFLAELGGPIQLHHGSSDDIVPSLFSSALARQLQAAGQTPELFTYPGDDHNIATNFDTAMERTVRFFDEHVKGQ